MVTFIIRSFTLDLSSSMLSTAAMEFARITSQWASEIACKLRKTGGPCVFLCFFVVVFSGYCKSKGISFLFIPQGMMNQFAQTFGRTPNAAAKY